MSLSQVGGDVSLGPLIVCCYSRALVTTDEHPVSLRDSPRPGLRSQGGEAVHQGSTGQRRVSVHWSLRLPFLQRLLGRCHQTLHLFISHDWRHPDRSGAKYIKSPGTLNLFLGICPKEIIGQVPQRCMYQVVCCRVLYRSKGLQMHRSPLRCPLSWIEKSDLHLLQLHLGP